MLSLSALSRNARTLLPLPGSSGPSCLLSALSRGLRTPGYREEHVCTNSDGSVLVCWHPEPRFPYEMTRPVPRGKGKVETDSK